MIFLHNRTFEIYLFDIYDKDGYDGGFLWCFSDGILKFPMSPSILESNFTFVGFL
jgi:hypothetical protein